MKRKTYTATVNAPAESVYAAMLGKGTYRKWVEAFDPTSDFEGTWEEGSEMRFTGVDENGKKGGMVSVIEKNEPNRYVAIRHIGMLDGDNAITEGPEVEGWAGAMEIYSFSEENGTTTVKVEIDTNEKYEDYFDKTWPEALGKLKEISEQGG
jgi:uncharacterized protein YndB with AHSA1/START domain